MSKINPATPQFQWPTLNINPASVPTFTDHLRGVKYKLGAKASPLDCPLKDIKAIDCSGFVRKVIHDLVDLTIPDGSWAQGEWCKQQGFKESTVDSGKLMDGVLRLAQLPQQPGVGVGRHIAFILNGRTYESCGGKGPTSRVWNGKGWQAKCKVWVLAHPSR